MKLKRNVKLVSRTLNKLYSYMWHSCVKGHTSVQAVARPAIYDRTLWLWRHINLPLWPRTARKISAETNDAYWELHLRRQPSATCSEPLRRPWSPRKAAHVQLRRVTLFLRAKDQVTMLLRTDKKGKEKGEGDILAYFALIQYRWTVLCNSSTIAALQDHCSNFISYTKGDIPAKLKAITADCIVAAVRQQSHNARGYLQDPVQPDSPARTLTCTRETEDNPQTE